MCMHALLHTVTMLTCTASTMMAGDVDVNTHDYMQNNYAERV